MKMKILKRWMPLSAIILSLFLFFYFQLDRYLSFSELKNHREALLSWTSDNFLLASILFIFLYIFSVAISVPGATFFTLLGGFLFGVVLGSIYVVFSATTGSLITFLAVRYALEPFVKNRTTKWMMAMRDGFQKNQFEYLLFLRLVPIFPFWVVNIIPAMLGVRFSTFLIATLIGIIPGSIVYVTLGNGLAYIFEQDKLPNLGIIFDPAIFLPLLALGILSILPALYKHRKARKNSEK